MRTAEYILKHINIIRFGLLQGGKDIQYILIYNMYHVYMYIYTICICMYVHNTGTYVHACIHMYMYTYMYICTICIDIYYDIYIYIFNICIKKIFPRKNGEVTGGKLKYDYDISIRVLV